jgi:hypothetical protein
MLIGEMENQCYTISALADKEQVLLGKLLARLNGMSAQNKAQANRQVEALEAARLATFGSEQCAIEGLNPNLRSLLDLLEISESELDSVLNFQGRYQYDVASSIFGGEYVHRLTETVSLNPHTVLKLRADDLYHHGHRFAHRLYIRANQPNSTLLVTTPVSQEAMGGSFQHPTWFSGKNVNYARRMYTPDELKTILLDYRQQLESAPAPVAGRFLDVAGSQSAAAGQPL